MNAYEFMAQLAELEESANTAKKQRRNRAAVLRMLAEINEETDTDSEAAAAMLDSGLSYEEIARRIKALNGVVHNMTLSLLMHVRLEHLEREQLRGPKGGDQ